jgi:hypothetical protein
MKYLWRWRLSGHGRDGGIVHPAGVEHDLLNILELGRNFNDLVVGTVYLFQLLAVGVGEGGTPRR